MFLRYRTPGFVLKKENSGEADQVFWVYTRDFGQLQVLGKGIRKTGSKLRGGIDVFCLSEIEFIEGRARKVLTDAVLLDRKSGLKKDLVGLRLSFRLARLFCNLVGEREPDPRLWRLLGETWPELEKEKLSFRAAILFYYHFFWNLVQLLGYRPRLDQEPFQEVSVNTSEVLQTILDRPWSALKKLKVGSATFSELKSLHRGYLNSLHSREKK